MIPVPQIHPAMAATMHSRCRGALDTQARETGLFTCSDAVAIDFLIHASWREHVMVAR
jgi:hypothetical protein